MKAKKFLSYLVICSLGLIFSILPEPAFGNVNHPFDFCMPEAFPMTGKVKESLEILKEKRDGENEVIQMIQKAMQKEEDSLVIVLRWTLSGYFLLQEAYPKAVYYGEEAIAAAQEHNSARLLGKSAFSLGVVLQKMGQRARALEYFLKAQLAFDKAEDNMLKAFAAQQAAGIYFSLGDFEKSCRLYSASVSYFQECQKQTNASYSKIQLARVCRESRKFEDAMNYLDEAKQYFSEQTLAQDSILFEIEYEYGLVFLESGDFSQSINVLTGVLNYANEHSPIRKAAIHTALGSSYLGLGYKGAARYHLIEAESLISFLPASEQTLEVLYHLASGFNKTGDFERAYSLIKHHEEIRRKIDIEERNKEIARIQDFFLYEQQKVDIGMLQSEKEIAQSEYRRFRTTVITIAGILLLMILIAIILVNSYRIKIRASRKLKQKNQEIGHQKRELELKNAALLIQKNEIQLQSVALEAKREQLESNNELLKKLSIVARETSNSVVVARYDGQLEWVNGGFERLFGLTLEELLLRGESIQKVSSCEDIDQKIKTCFQTRTAITYQSVFPNSKGEKIWLQTTLNPVFDNEGNPKRLVVVESDVSNLKKAEEYLALLNLDLEKRVKEEAQKNRNKDLMLTQQSRHAIMGEMISNIAHQWRQPLNAIGLIVQNLREAYAMEQVNEKYVKTKVGKIMDLIHYMSQTIDDFRNFFMPDKEKQVFNLFSVVEKALSFVEPAFKSHNIELEKNLSNDLECVGYPNEFTQVLLNLLNNSKEAVIRNNNGKGKITVELFKEDSAKVLLVKDTGGGVPDDIQNRIFQPYFTTREESGGTGIGLYMSKTIIEKNMGGKISFRNIEGGAEFRIEI